MVSTLAAGASTSTNLRPEEGEEQCEDEDDQQ